MSAPSIAASASAARWSGRGIGHACARGAGDCACLYRRSHPEIWEVILTGGDPLVLSPRRLGESWRSWPASSMSRSCAGIRGCRSSRRSRITPELIAALTASGKTVYVALHANHPRELTPEARQLAAGSSMPGSRWSANPCCSRASTTIVETLGALMRGFVEARVKPYYLHQAISPPAPRICARASRKAAR